MSVRIVVVGHSAVTCLGSDMDTTWGNLVAGRSGIKRHESLSSESFLRDVAGRVEDVGPGTAGEEPAVAKLESGYLHFALRAARAALEDAGLTNRRAEIDPHRVAVSVGSAFGGQDLLESEMERSRRRKSLSMSPYLIPALIINQAAGQIAQHLGFYGPSIAPANACASGGHAIASAAMFLRAGEADLALAGGSESAFTPAIVNGFATMKALASQKPGDRAFEDPSKASRPFSGDRNGFVMAEGAGMLLLATEAEAKRLGLEIQAELVGWGSNTDGHHLTMPCRERIAHGLKTVLQRAGIAPESIDYYNAHGTSTPVNDRTETEVLHDVFGAHARNLPISSIKGAVGHALGAASAIEAAVCVRALREQILPPTINFQVDAELDLDYIPDQARPTPIEYALSASFGFGGTNNALILKRGDR
ncbi:MAG: beta-ketoacyl-[acyl-carrier-protein] synthase family protein [Isosphaeraceae bacterium]|nr:beta-ketoacyl-[acyl-carrier-protein] synthase family protein [Isosphaeraceae bacterium]